MAKGHSNHSTETTRIHHDARVWLVYCAECNEQFEATRSDATFCSGKCRTHAARAPQRLANALSFIDGLNFTLTNYARQYKRNAYVFRAMQRLHACLSNCLLMFENHEIGEG